MRWLTTLACLAVLALAGCAGSQAPDAAVSGSSAAAFRATADASSAIPLEDYKVSAEDVLDITVFKVPELSKKTKVSGSGQIAMPLIGPVQVAGKTTAEIEGEIERRLAADYLQSPEVSVAVEDAVSQRITLEGAVSNPGVYPTSGRTTLLQAISIAGGLTDLADPRGIVVFRNVNGVRNAAVFDYASIRDGRDDDPIILGGDIVTVDQSGVKAAYKGLRQSIGVIGLFLPMI